MSNLKDKLLKGTELSVRGSAISQSKTGFKLSIHKSDSLQSRINKANQASLATHEDIALLLDDSSSMEIRDDFIKSRMDYLREAVIGFANEIDFVASKVLCVPFNSSSFISTTQAQLKGSYIAQSGGSTPMHRAIKRLLDSTILRGILISDGEADNEEWALSEARSCAALPTKKKIDCVHIGHSRDGEVTLRRIAELTGGLYFKFKDLESFRSALRELAPRRRLALEAKTADEIKRLTGATEVIKH